MDFPIRNDDVPYSYVNVYQRVIQPDCKCSTDSMSCLTCVVGIVSGATLTNKKSWDKQCRECLHAKMSSGESARVGSCLGEQGGLGARGGLSVKQGSDPYGGLLTWGYPTSKSWMTGSFGILGPLGIPAIEKWPSNPVENHRTRFSPSGRA